MSGDQVLLEVAAAVADGAPVDWAALEGRVSDEHDRKMLRNLRMLASVGDVHETTLELPGPGASPLAPKGEESITATSPSSRRWGRYELLARIGEGGQGTVYRAWDPQLECEVALKVLQPHHATTDVVGERVLREGRALARVRDPHVVNVYNVERHEGQIALCMEFIKGQTLDDILTLQGPFGPHEATAVGICVGRALAKVHDAGLIHRDIKTRNVMREEKGRIVLMDFGTGRDSAQLRSGGGDLAGTPLYMAPEVLSGLPASQQSDIYSLGVLLYHLVTGRFPVEGRTFEEILSAHRNQRRTALAERRPDLPEDFIRVIERAIAPEPAARYATVGMMVHDLVVLDAASDESVAPPWTAVQWVTFGAGLVGAIVLACFTLGFINTTAYNAMLERTTVATDGFRDWFVWGLKSLIGPIAGTAQLVIEALAVVLVWRLLMKISTPVNRFSKRVRLKAVEVGGQLGLYEPDGFMQMAFLVGLAALLYVFFVHWNIIGATTTVASRLTPEQRHLLSYDNASEHETYRSTLDLIVLGTGLALWWRLRMRSKPRTVTGAALVAAVAGVLAMSTLLWAAPYRLLFQADALRVTYAGQRCYELGQEDSEILVYCPEGQQPKIRRVPGTDPQLERTGIVENIYKPE